jgi:hypothetical protein
MPAPAARGGVPTEDPLAPLTCSSRVNSKDVIVRGVALSPDQSSVALARDLNRAGRVVTATARDRELERVQLFDRASAAITDLGRGTAPFAWSADSAKLAFYDSRERDVIEADVIVFDVGARREVARLHGSGGALAWSDGALLYEIGTTLRSWTPTQDRALLQRSPDEAFSVSADGAMIAIARYRDERIAQLRVVDAVRRTTDTFADVWAYDWSPRGHRLVVSYLDRAEIRDENGAVARFDHPVHTWAWSWGADGRRPIFAEPAPEHGVTEIVPPVRALITIDRTPALVGIPLFRGTLTRDGQYIGVDANGWDPPSFAIYDCDRVAPAYAPRPKTQTLYYPETTEPWAAARDGTLPAAWDAEVAADLTRAGIHPLSVSVARPIPEQPLAECGSPATCVNGRVLVVTIPYDERERAFARCFQIGDGVTYIPSTPLQAYAQGNCVGF